MGILNLIGRGLIASGDLSGVGSQLVAQKATTKTINTTTSPVDLLNGEFVLPMPLLDKNGIMRFKAYGDWLHNGGVNSAPVRFQVVFGGATIIDTGTSGTCGVTASRASWSIEAEIRGGGTFAAQTWNFGLEIGFPNNQVTATNNAFTTGSGAYTNAGVGVVMLMARGFNTSAADQTRHQPLVLNAILATNNASEEITCYAASVEII